VDPNLIQLIFASNFNVFPHRTPGGGSIGGGHIFGHTLDIISDMPRWKRLRSTLSVGFSTKQLNQMMQAIETSIENFVNKIENLHGNEINAKMVSGNFAADAFTTAAFSMSLTADTSIAEFDKVPFTKAMLDVLTPTVQFIIPVIVPYGGEMMDAFGLSVYPKKSIEYFEKFCRQILSQRKEIKEGRTSDFINLMLNAQIDESDKISSTKGMTLDEMIAQLFVFFVAGYETTANTVTSILYFLAKNPQYIEKLRQEADGFEAKDMNSLTSESIPLTCAILNEALRLLPPVGVNFRVATLPNNAELELNGIKFKDGFNVEIPNDLLHTHPEFWGQNGQEFYPERWLQDKSLEKSWFFQPFGGGPRNCIGMRLALMEIKLGVLKIIQRFDPVVETDDVKFTRNSYTLLETNKPLMMKFKPRNYDFNRD